MASKCYRRGGCGPYEQMGCNECPASKPEYAARYGNYKTGVSVQWTTPPMPEEGRIETNMYDQEEIIYPATVQILTNTITGEQSVGWWRGSPDDMPKKVKPDGY